MGHHSTPGLAALASSLQAANTLASIARELRAWHNTGLRIAIWGGAGESAAFLQTHGIDALRFPVVVDSDPANAGATVPGTGQTIRSPDWLLRHPADIILIPCHERAADIVRQIDAAHIAYEGILVPHHGHLVDFHAAEIVIALT
jgi:hypothetical protein